MKFQVSVWLIMYNEQNEQNGFICKLKRRS